MKTISKRGSIIIGLVTLLSVSTTLSAQDKVEANLGLDLVNQYIWRGQDLGNVSLQPTLGASWKGLSLSAWGSVGFDKDDTKELDLALSYSTKGFTVGLTDYWFSKGSYFQYKSGKTTHIWEGFVGYDFKYFSATWYTNFAGDDGKNNSLKRAYSSYIELVAPFSLAGLDWEGSVGIVPWATTTYGTTGFACTNVGLKATKDFVIKEKYHLPVFVGLNANPDSGKMYLLCGLGFKI